MTPLAPHIEAFFRDYLVRHRGVSPHTCDSYAYSFQALFEFASRKLRVAPSALMLEQLDASLISLFLNIWRPYVATPRRHEISVWLRSARSSGSCSTTSHPPLQQVRRVSAIPFKNRTIVLVPYLAQEKCRPCSMLLIPSTRMGVSRPSHMHLAAVCGPPSL